jgi:hypothetical protein
MQDTTGFAAYTLYQALKLHFTSDYDYFKYNGKTNVSKDSFMHNKAKYSFYKLSRKYSHDDLKDFFVANFIDRNVSWVGEITGPEGEETYKKWQKRIQGLTYQFEQNIIQLMDSVSDPNELLIVKNGQYPKLLVRTLENDITIETLVILNDIMNFFPMWEKKIQDTIVWPDYRKRIVKYSPFLIYDKKKFKNILLESVKEHEQT